MKRESGWPACFRVVFPDLPEAEIPSASQETVAAWDSVAAITLLNVVEEEFGVEMDLDELADLDSFAKGPCTISRNDCRWRELESLRLHHMGYVVASIDVIHARLCAVAGGVLGWTDIPRSQSEG